MRTVWKFPLEITDMQSVKPFMGQFTHVGLDPSGQPCVWAVVDPDLPTAPSILFIVGTGNQVPDEATTCLGSFVQGPFVWHVFESVL